MAEPKTLQPPARRSKLCAFVTRYLDTADRIAIERGLVKVIDAHHAGMDLRR